jgi:hypothetical protein
MYKSYKSLTKFNIRSQLNIIFISHEVKGFFFTSKSTIILVCYTPNVPNKDAWILPFWVSIAPHRLHRQGSTFYCGSGAGKYEASPIF